MKTFLEIISEEFRLEQGNVPHVQKVYHNDIHVGNIHTALVPRYFASKPQSEFITKYVSHPPEGYDKDWKVRDFDKIESAKRHCLTQYITGTL